MKLTPRKINNYLLLKLPAAFFCGVRVKSITPQTCTTAVRYRWINQNPFNSMFWAVQGMAAELSTGALVMGAIKESNQNISMLVTGNKGFFYKKAKGKITFTCSDGRLIFDTVKKAIETKEGQIITVQSVGKNEKGETVSLFDFNWSLKVK